MTGQVPAGQEAAEAASDPYDESSAHATLGASNSKRWMNCPGSIAASAGLTDEGSIYAREGTAAHTLAEMCLTIGMDADDFMGHKLTDEFTVDEDMAAAVQRYLDTVRPLMLRPGAISAAETKVSLAALAPPMPMFGTADHISYYPAERMLDVTDYKHGAGVAVEVIDNSQAMFYGAGAAIEFAKRYGHAVEKIRLRIVQPRAPHPAGPVREWVIDAFELFQFMGELIAAARRTMLPDAPLNPGDWCRFCPAAGRCKALEQRAYELAQLAFDDPTALLEPPPPDTLSPERLAHVLDNVEMIETWVHAVRAYAHNEIHRGGTIPGWRLAPKRAHRKWKDEAAAKTWMLGLGVAREKVVEEKLISPSQAEKIVPVGTRGDARKARLAGLGALIEPGVSSGSTLCRESDQRPRVEGIDQFDVEDLFG